MSLIGHLPEFQSQIDDIERWIDLFNNYLTANSIDSTKAEERCIAIFLSSVGMQTYQIIADLTAPDAPNSKKLDELKDLLKAHFKPSPKAIAERFKFASRKQKSGESVSKFLAELRKLATTCKFATNLEERLRDQFIFGLISDKAQKVLFTKDDDIALSNTVAIALAQETAETSLAVIRESALSSSVPASEDVHKSSMKQQQSFHQRRPKKQKPKSCPNCGSSKHSSQKECPHKDVDRFNCGKKGHFAKYCRSESKKKISSKPKGQVAKVQSVNHVSSDLITVQVTVNNVPHRMELDTGCSRSLLSAEFWRNSLGSPKLQPSHFTFKTYTKETFKAMGQFTCQLKYEDQEIQHTFQVVEGTSLFGRDLLKTIKLDWSVVAAQCHTVSSASPQSLKALLEEFKELFESPMGRIKGFQARVVLKDEVTPKFCKARPLPFAIRHKVEKELENMEKAGVIERVEHSDWATPLVVVPRADGKVRITADFKVTINPHLCINQYPLTQIDELFAKVSGGQTFSKIDGSDAYHQVEVEESSRKYLVVNTHRGLYRYNVLPQGIASAPAIFQELMDKMLEGISMTGTFIDDTLTTGRSEAEHLKNLKQVFTKMRQYNYRLSKRKSKFMVSSTEFLGHVISQDGIHTSPAKVEVIRSIQRPQNITELKSFLGLVNFYGKFVPFLSDKCEPLNRLTRNGVVWNGSKKCQQAFDFVKSFLTSPQTLAHFDMSKPVGISCDASATGLGVVLFHSSDDGSEKPIAFASKTLSECERKYSQIEKEGLAIIFGMKKFSKYLYGQKFTLVTDHKPLLAIFGEKSQLPPLASTRLHRWALFLSQFHYSVVYRKSSDHGNADALSRLPCKSNQPTFEEEHEVVSLVTETVHPLPVTAKQIRFQSAKDKVLSLVFRFVQNGWPTSVDQSVNPYFSRHHELSIVQGVLMWGLRVIVPKSLQQKVLNQLHETHSGIVRMKALARQFVWWPGIDKEIEELAKCCSSCAENRKNPQSAPLHPWAYPEKEWQRLHVDLAGPFLNSMWLVIVDAHSKWPEVYRLRQDATAASVILRLRETFSRFGVPEHLVSDNGTQFTAAEFQTFCKSNGIRHSTSSAYHPRSNGEAERFIQTFKDAMKCSSGDSELTLQRFLLNYRVTPHATTGSSPAELLQKRKPRTLFDLVRPNVSSNVFNSQSKQSEHFSSARKVREVKIGEKVWVKTYWKHQPKWTLGEIIRKIGPVTYNVKVLDRIIKRHIDQILQATPTSQTVSEADWEVESPNVPRPSSTRTPTSSPSGSRHTTPSSSAQSPESRHTTPVSSPVSSDEFYSPSPPSSEDSPPQPQTPQRRVQPSRPAKTAANTRLFQK